MIALSTVSLSELKTSDLPLALFVHEDAGVVGHKALAPALRRSLAELAKAEGFKGGAGECCSVLHAEKGAAARRYLLVGLGKRKDAGREAARRAAGGLFAFAKARFAAVAVLPAVPLQPVAEGLALASYSFDEYKKADAPKLAEAKFVWASVGERSSAEKAVSRALLGAEAVALVRDLVNRGPSDKTPQSLAELAESFKGHGVSVELIDKAKAQELGMGAFLGVARGSAVDPVMIHLHYKPKAGGKKKVALVGKGITFDSGGLSLKPPQSMETMKSDMAGAATVLGLFKVLPRLAPKCEVHGVCAVTYNMPGPDAMKPGDIIKASNGKTIEVLNTDAEGRLVLADALVYSGKLGVDATIDMATLTGAVVIALGSKVTGAMGNNRALLNAVKAAADRADEPVCELPLPADYKEQIKGSVADLQNIGKARGEGGAIIGGLFLEEFVDGKPWVHLDIAGTAWTDHDGPNGPKGGTGNPVRTLIEYLSAL